jgi:galactokinase
MSEFFSASNKIFTATAPGRLDVMGGIADYSGSLLLQMPIKQTTTVQVQQRSDTNIIIRSLVAKNKAENFLIDAGALSHKDIKDAAALIHSMPGGDWAAYITGCYIVLHQQKKIPLTGLNILVQSTVPAGKGVSSSAALEVAVMCALCKLFDISLRETELPLLAQQAENLVVGAPCGLMDQLSSYLGQKNKLLPLICQPHTVLPAVKIPTGISFCAIDSGIRHAVSGASYGDVRTAAFMAYTIIALQAGCSLNDLQLAKSSGQWSALPYQGFLGNIPLTVFENEYINSLPEQISGEDFLKRYELSIDAVTEIAPGKTYRLKSCAKHPVQENSRINSFMKLIQNFPKPAEREGTLKQMGKMMFESHAGYSDIGLGNENTDEIVEMVRSAGPGSHVYGARITGGGSGGTVCLLCYGKEGKATAKEIFKQYRSKYKIKSFFFSGSTDGALVLNSMG